jgi:uncharacterized membrane protein YgcG
MAYLGSNSTGIHEGRSEEAEGAGPDELQGYSPRNPPLESRIGQAKDRQHEVRTMKITRVLQSTILAVAIAGAFLMTPTAANARVFVSVGFAPPLIPIYAQPIAPGYGYIWTPGYWAYGDDGYYWVDGEWVYPPYVGALWTPGYWGWYGGAYLWYPGYWGRRVGYYGGINYGFGYFGVGFWGGYWRGGRFFYNGEYNHLGFHNEFVYSHRVEGFDGRPGGAAFARGTVAGLNRGAVAENRGAGINGNSFANRGSTATPRATYNNGARSYGSAPTARSYSGGGSYSGGVRGSYSGGGRSFSGGGARASGGGGGGRSGGGGGRR